MTYIQNQSSLLFELRVCPRERPFRIQGGIQVTVHHSFHYTSPIVPNRSPVHADHRRYLSHVLYEAAIAMLKDLRLVWQRARGRPFVAHILP
jgi:hypothetical protein